MKKILTCLLTVQLLFSSLFPYFFINPIPVYAQEECPFEFKYPECTGEPGMLRDVLQDCNGNYRTENERFEAGACGAGQDQTGQPEDEGPAPAATRTSDTPQEGETLAPDWTPPSLCQAGVINSCFREDCDGSRNELICIAQIQNSDCSTSFQVAEPTGRSCDSRGSTPAPSCQEKVTEGCFRKDCDTESGNYVCINKVQKSDCSVSVEAGEITEESCSAAGSIVPSPTPIPTKPPPPPPPQSQTISQSKSDSCSYCNTVSCRLDCNQRVASLRKTTTATPTPIYSNYFELRTSPQEQVCSYMPDGSPVYCGGNKPTPTPTPIVGDCDGGVVDGCESEVCDDNLGEKVCIEKWSRPPECKAHGPTTYRKPGITTGQSCGVKVTSDLVDTACRVQRISENVGTQCDLNKKVLVTTELWRNSDCSYERRPGVSTKETCGQDMSPEGDLTLAQVAAKQSAGAERMEVGRKAYIENIKKLYSLPPGWDDDYVLEWMEEKIKAAQVVAATPSKSASEIADPQYLPGSGEEAGGLLTEYGRKKASAAGDVAGGLGVAMAQFTSEEAANDCSAVSLKELNQTLFLAQKITKCVIQGQGDKQLKAYVDTGGAIVNGAVSIYTDADRLIRNAKNAQASADRLLDLQVRSGVEQRVDHSANIPVLGGLYYGGSDSWVVNVGIASMQQRQIFLYKDAIANPDHKLLAGAEATGDPNQIRKTQEMIAARHQYLEELTAMLYGQYETNLALWEYIALEAAPIGEAVGVGGKVLRTSSKAFRAGEGATTTVANNLDNAGKGAAESASVVQRAAPEEISVGAYYDAKKLQVYQEDLQTAAGRAKLAEDIKNGRLKVGEDGQLVRISEEDINHFVQNGLIDHVDTLPAAAPQPSRFYTNGQFDQKKFDEAVYYGAENRISAGLATGDAVTTPEKRLVQAVIDANEELQTAVRSAADDGGTATAKAGGATGGSGTARSSQSGGPVGEDVSALNQSVSEAMAKEAEAIKAAKQLRKEVEARGLDDTARAQAQKTATEAEDRANQLRQSRWQKEQELRDDQARRLLPLDEEVKVAQKAFYETVEEADQIAKKVKELEEAAKKRGLDDTARAEKEKLVAETKAEADRLKEVSNLRKQELHEATVRQQQAVAPVLSEIPALYDDMLANASALERLILRKSGQVTGELPFPKTAQGGTAQGGGSVFGRLGNSLGEAASTAKKKVGDALESAKSKVPQGGKPASQQKPGVVQVTPAPAKSVHVSGAQRGQVAPKASSQSQTPKVEPAPVKFSGGGKSFQASPGVHKGVPNNQDVILTNIPQGRVGVFDGVTTYGGGLMSTSEIASNYAQMAFEGALSKLGTKSTVKDVERAMKEAWTKTQRDIAGSVGKRLKIGAMTQEVIGKSGSSTTLTVVQVVEEQGKKIAVIGHAGDTRAYLIKKNGSLVPLTRDDAPMLGVFTKEALQRSGFKGTLDEYVQQAQILLGEARNAKEAEKLIKQNLGVEGGDAIYNHRNYIDNSLGDRGGVLRIRTQPLADDDLGIIVTSDGVHDSLTFSQIQQTVRQNLQTPQQISDMLIANARNPRIAKDRMKPDDISAVFLGLSGQAPSRVSVVGKVDGVVDQLKSLIPSSSKPRSFFPLINLVKTAQADNSTQEEGMVFDAEVVEDMVRSQLVKERIKETGGLDLDYQLELAAEDILVADGVQVDDGYLLTTGKEGTVRWQVEGGQYKLEMDPITDTDITIPQSVNLKPGTNTVIGIAVKKGNSSVNTTSSEGVLNELLAKLLRQEGGEGKGQLDLGYAQVTLVLFKDDDGNGKYDEGEVILPWSGATIKLTEVNPVESILLNPGWNLVTLTILPGETMTASSLLKVITAQGGEATTVSQLVDGGWKSYVGRGEAEYSIDDFPLELGQAYFVKALKQSTFTYTGQNLIAPVKLKLQSGWNTVGIPFSQKSYQAGTLLEAVSNSGAESDAVSWWDSGLWDTFVKKNQQNFGNNFPIENTRGYILRVGKEIEWRPE